MTSTGCWVVWGLSGTCLLRPEGVLGTLLWAVVARAGAQPSAWRRQVIVELAVSVRELGETIHNLMATVLQTPTPGLSLCNAVSLTLMLMLVVLVVLILGMVLSAVAISMLLLMLLV